MSVFRAWGLRVASRSIGQSTPAPTAIWNPASLAAALGFSALTWFALGVDFPRANIRFSRLV